MKASTIQNIYMNLSGVGAKELPVKMSFVLSRNLKKLREVVQDIDAKRNELLNKYGEKDDKGELIVADNGSVKIPDADKFMAELNEVLNADVDITLDKVTEADIEKCDNEKYDSLTVDEIGALEYMMAQEAAK